MISDEIVWYFAWPQHIVIGYIKSPAHTHAGDNFSYKAVSHGYGWRGR